MNVGDATASTTTAPFEALTEDQLRSRTSLKWQFHGPDVLPAWVAEMDVLQSPAVVAAVTRAVRDGDTGYPNQGTTYKEALAEFAAEQWDWAPDAAHMMLCADVMSGIGALVDSFTPRGGSVIIPGPVYPPFALFTRLAGRRVVHVGLTEQGRLDIAAIEAALTQADGPEPSMLLLCSPHNPTGTVHTAQELTAVAAVARRSGAVVVVDEVHAPLVPAGASFVPWLSITDQGFVVTSAAKAFNLAGLKAGLIVAGTGSADQLSRLPLSVPYGGSHLGVIGHSAAYRGGRGWLAAVNDNIAASRELLGELIRAELPGVRYRAPQATYLAWLDLRGQGLGEDPARVILARSRVALTSGKHFGPGGEGHARINFACSSDVLTRVVRGIAAAIAAGP